MEGQLGYILHQRKGFYHEQWFPNLSKHQNPLLIKTQKLHWAPLSCGLIQQI